MSRKGSTRKNRVFAKPSTQAKRACIAMFKAKNISSIGTSNTYQEGLTRFGEWLEKNRCGPLEQSASLARAERFLAERAGLVGQKTLDRDRQAVQALLRWQGKLDEKTRIKVIQADKAQTLVPRAYAADQVTLIIQRMTPRNALAVEIAHAAGLRAHELITLERRDEMAPDPRPADPEKFAGLEDHVIYVTTGKGGLRREVAIPQHLAERLEATRLETPRTRRDRGTLYRQKYDIGGGQALSQAFSRASTLQLAYSTGLHGVRHDYAQQSDHRALLHTGDPERAKLITSQLLGHFRPEITEVYRR